MLLGIPKLLSPQLLAALCEMGHGDTIVLGDANFPGKKLADACMCQFIRADGHGIPELLDAILSLIPCDAYVHAPVMLMDKTKADRDIPIPIWAEYRAIVEKHDPRGGDAIGFYERFQFYEETKKAYCIVQTGEASLYANVMIQKGVIK